MTFTASVFEKTYQDYLSQISTVDLTPRAEILGGKSEGNRILVSFFGKPYAISSDDICDLSGNRPSFAVRVVLSKYVLMCPEFEPVNAEWASYRDFRDAAPFAGAFSKNAEIATARYFSGRLQMLGTALQTIGGRQPNMELAYDIAQIVDALPKVPILLLFNDTDEEFPATCSILFEKRAEKYLDMECLAIIGWHLADCLKRVSGGSGAPLM